MMRLRAFLPIWLFGKGPLVTSLTAFQAEMALENAHHFFHLMTLPGERAHLFGAETEPIGRGVLAAVLHHAYLETSGA
jgi:hypothetical protein